MKEPKHHKKDAKKKSYKKPKLVRYGSLKDLTKFGGSSSADFFGMQA